MSGGTLRRGRRAARMLIALWTLAALAAACESDDPVAPEVTGGEEPELPELPEPCDAVGVADDGYADGVNCRTVEVDGYPREFLVYVPAAHTFTAETPAPVVLMFHGSSGTGERFYRISRWKEKADEVGLIAVFPTGLEYLLLETGRWTTRWHTFGLPDQVDLEQQPDDYPEDAPWPADDIAFVRAMLDDLEGELQVDPERFYASGFSNGGAFTSRLAIEATDRIAAFSYLGGAFCTPRETDWTSAPPRSAFHVYGAYDDRFLELIAAVGGPELDRLPLDADSLLAIFPVATCMQSQAATFELDSAKYSVREESRSTQFEWTTPMPGTPDRGNTYRFAVLDGLGHKYPNEDNNTPEWVAADFFWEFFRDLRLTN